MSGLFQYSIIQYYKLNKALHRFTSTGWKECYCQFTGGGDIFIPGEQETMVINQLNEEAMLKLSPRDDETCISGFVIEGFELHHLQHQLFADTVLTSIISFVKEGKYSEATTLDVKRISGYGIAYTGSGLRFYKVEIKFDNPMKFQLQHHPLAYAAAVYCDFTLDYCLESLTLYYPKANKVAQTHNDKQTAVRRTPKYLLSIPNNVIIVLLY